MRSTHQTYPLLTLTYILFYTDKISALTGDSLDVAIFIFTIGYE
jgi:hypothetical protein